MKLSKADAVSLLKGVGYGKAVESFPAERLEAKIANLPKRETLECSEDQQPLLEKVLKALGDGEDVTVKTDKSAANGKPDKKGKSAEKASGKNGKPDKADKKAGKKANDASLKPGVVAFIAETLKGASKDSPMTKDELLKKCKAKFPDRDPDGMAKTIKNQTSYFLSHNGHNLQRDGAGGYWIAKTKKVKA